MPKDTPEKSKDAVSKIFGVANYQLLILFGTLILFLISNSLFRDDKVLSIIPPILGILIVIEFFVFVGMEVKSGAKKHGWTHEIVDTVIALAIAFGIWYGLAFVLNSPTPISGVVSCSMLPNLQRGDFVIVQGADVNAYEINMTKSELDSISELKSTIYYPEGPIEINGSIFSKCVYNSNNDLCRFFISNPDKLYEQKGPFTYNYQKCTLAFSNGSTYYQPCLKSVVFKGKEYLTDFSHDIIVYQPTPSDYFAQVGDIVHRAFFKINVDDEVYYLARGDNNPVLDLQIYSQTNQGNSPVPADHLRGKVIFRIPYLGYFKLFISGFFNEDPQCKTQLEFEHLN